MKRKNQPDFKIIHKEEIDKRFENIIKRASPDMEHFEIQTIINTEAFNTLVVAMNMADSINDLTVYRVTIPFENFDQNSTSHYSYPPKQYSKQGRANLEGYPVFYCSVDPITAIKEMKGSLSKDTTCYVSEWKIDFSLPLYIHNLMYNSQTINSKNIRSHFAKRVEDHLKLLVKNMRKDEINDFLYMSKKIGNLFTTKGDEYYHITSSYAHDKIYHSQLEELNISMILYPSMENKEDGINLAIHPDLIDSRQVSLQSVHHIKIKNLESNNGISVSTMGKGLCNNGEIAWKKPHVILEGIDYDSMQLLTYNNSEFTGSDALNLVICNTKESVFEFLQNKGREGIVHFLLTRDIESNKDLFRFTNEKHTESITIIYPHGMEVETINGKSCIYQIEVDIRWWQGYK